MKNLLTCFALLIGFFAFSQITTTNVLNLKQITTAQRDALTIAAGQYPVIYNTTTGQYERYNGASWETWDVDFTESNNLGSAVTWANIPDANVPESAVTQHEAALSIATSQITSFAANATEVNTGTENAKAVTPLALAGSALQSKVDGIEAGATADQIASEVSIADSGAIITATDVEGALQENRTAIDLNTAKTSNATHTGEVTGATALTIASGVVDSDNIVDGTIQAVDLEDTDTPADNEVPTYDAATGGFTWEAQSVIGANQLTDLIDVNTATTTNRNVLVADGIDFESRALVEADISDLSHTVDTDDQTASEVTSTATGDVAATDVDAAIAELESEKLQLGSTNAVSALTSAEETGSLVGWRIATTTNTFTIRGGDSGGTSAVNLILSADDAELTGLSESEIDAAGGTSLITKEYLDAHNITYDNTDSGLAATDAKAGIDEVQDNIDNLLPVAQSQQIVKGVTDATKGVDFDVDTNVPTSTVVTISAPSADTDLEDLILLHPDSPQVIDSVYVGTVAQIAAAGLGSDVLAFPTDATNNLDDIDDVVETSITTDDMLQWNGTNWVNVPKEEVTEKKFIIPLGAVGDDIAVATKVNFVPVHDAITITRVEAHLDTAPTGSVATFDINEDGTSILSTKLTIDATEKWSDDAATQAVISDTAIDAKSVLSVDVDGVGSTVAGADGTITIYYTID